MLREEILIEMNMKATKCLLQCAAVQSGTRIPMVASIYKAEE